MMVFSKESTVSKLEKASLHEANEVILSLVSLPQKQGLFLRQRQTGNEIEATNEAGFNLIKANDCFVFPSRFLNYSTKLSGHSLPI